MNAPVLVGTVLVMLSWAFAAMCVVILGLIPALLIARRLNAQTIRGSLWWGMLIATLLILSVGLWRPLSSSSVAIAIFAAVLASCVASAFLIRRYQQHDSNELGRSQRFWPRTALLVVLVVCLIYLAVSVLGPVTNYDSGLYHLGAIAYASDYTPIPGLANMSNALGYNNSIFPLAAFLGNGPWDGEGFRLINGLFMVLMALDVIFRLQQRRFTTGTYVLLLGLLAAWTPLIAISDYWVASPTSDTAVFILSVVAVAYLADFLTSKKIQIFEASVALVAAFLIVSMRPTMLFFVAGIFIVIVAMLISQRRKKNSATSTVSVATLLLALGALWLLSVQTVRDYFLSGWVEYPLSLHKFNVDWAAVDPVISRAATLGNARDPVNLWESAQGWTWVSPWFSNAMHQWETFEFLGLALLACMTGIAAVIRMRRQQTPVRIGRVCLALAPSLIAVVIWWTLTPPAYRFIWGPLFLIPIVVIAWSLGYFDRSGAFKNLVKPLTLIAVAGILGVLVVGCSVTRLDLSDSRVERQWHIGSLSLTYSTVPIPTPPVKKSTLAPGFDLLMPKQGDQCWDNYPLCTGGLEAGLAMRGNSIQDGFTHN